MIIRDAIADDAVALVEMGQAFFAEAGIAERFEALGLPDIGFCPKSFLLSCEMLAKTGAMLVAEVDGELVGSAGLHPTGPALRRRHVMMLGISVVGAMQGRGVGTALMAALCDYADQWLGIRRLELDVYADNQRALALYRKFGFEVEGTHRGYAMRDGVLVDSLSMARLRPAPPFAHETQGQSDA